MSMIDFSLLSSQAAAFKGVLRLDASKLFLTEAEWISDRTVENIRRLQSGDSVALVAAVNADALGGPLAQWLKCLTAIKSCEELEKHSIAAVPVCRIEEASPAKDSIALLDGGGELIRLDTNGRQTSDLILKIEELGQGTYDPETAAMLRSACSPNASPPLTAARLFSGLMKEWGLVVTNPGQPFSDLAPESIVAEASRLHLPEAERMFLFASSILPAIAIVVDPCDRDVYAEARTLWDRLDLVRPVRWPASRAVLVDSKSRRTLEKYNLGIDELFAGETEVVDKIKRRLPDSESLERLRLEAQRALSELESLAPADEGFLKMKKDCEEKIIYQIEKIRKNLESAKAVRIEAARRQVRRACNFLAPAGQPQERELAGVYFLLRFSRAALRRIYERLDGTASGCQPISMD